MGGNGSSSTLARRIPRPSSACSLSVPVTCWPIPGKGYSISVSSRRPRWRIGYRRRASPHCSSIPTTVVVAAVTGPGGSSRPGHGCCSTRWIVEPASLLDSGRVLTDLGKAPASYSTMKRTLRRVKTGKYRDRVAAVCFAHARAAGDVSLCLYDVTTLYFEAENEDTLRRVGYSKERRVDPQIVVGLLVDRCGFPLEIGCFEGDKAETLTIPITNLFIERHGLAGMVIVADAGMLSATNLTALDDAGLTFIVGSRATKAPIDLASHFRWHGDAFTDGQLIDTITPKNSRTVENDAARRAEPVWDRRQHPGSWRAVWAYSAKRAVWDNKTLTLQANRAREVISGTKKAKTTRFVKTSGDKKVLDETSLARARRLVGLKGYVTNLPSDVMPTDEVIANYHDLWQVEQSFRMSKTDLRARPMFHHTRDAIEAHLTIVFTALAVSREAQNRTGLAIGNLVRQLRPLRSATIAINGTQQTALNLPRSSPLRRLCAMLRSPSALAPHSLGAECDISASYQRRKRTQFVSAQSKLLISR